MLPLEVGLVVYRAMPCAEGIVAQVIVFESSACAVGEPYGFVAVFRNRISTRDGISFAPYPQPRTSIPNNFIIFEYSTPISVYIYAALLSIVQRNFAWRLKVETAG